MRRQVDHHLARARAIGRRASAHARDNGVGEPRGGRARGRPAVRGCHGRHRRRSRSGGPGRAPGPRRNARQPRRECREIRRRPGVRHGRAAGQGFVDIAVEDDGPGIPDGEREAIFDRGARLDTTASPEPGSASRSCATSPKSTAARITLEESEDLGGLLARLSLPCRMSSRRSAAGSSAAAHCSHGASRWSKSFARSRSARAFPRRFGGVKIHDITSSWRSRARVSWRFPRRRSRSGKPAFGTWGYDPPAMDSAVKPGDDFFDYVNGSWVKRTEIAADRTFAGIDSVLNDQIEKDVRAIVEDHGQGSDGQWPPRPADRRLLRQLDGRSGRSRSSAPRR